MNNHKSIQFKDIPIGSLIESHTLFPSIMFIYAKDEINIFYLDLQYDRSTGKFIRACFIKEYNNNYIHYFYNTWLFKPEEKNTNEH